VSRVDPLNVSRVDPWYESRLDELTQSVCHRVDEESRVVPCVSRVCHAVVRADGPIGYKAGGCKMLIGFNVINSIELFRKHSISVLVMLSVSMPKKYHCGITQSCIIQSPEASRATPRRTTIQTFRVCVEEILFRSECTTVF
jgi:hypothetical protein